MEGKILGVSVPLEHLTNPDVARKYEDGIDAMEKQMHKAMECERGSDGLRMQCEAVKQAMEEIFGEEKTTEILGENPNLIRCMDAFSEYVDLYSEQVTPALEKRLERFHRSRIHER